MDALTLLPAPPALAHLPQVTQLGCVGDVGLLGRVQWALAGSCRLACARYAAPVGGRSAV